MSYAIHRLLAGGDLMNQPNQPSEETKRKMVEFFMRTSVPRIIADMKKQEQEQKEKEAS
jgi:hypothetical protein